MESGPDRILTGDRKRDNAEIGRYSTNIILQHPGREAWMLFLNTYTA